MKTHKLHMPLWELIRHVNQEWSAEVVARAKAKTLKTKRSLQKKWAGKELLDRTADSLTQVDMKMIYLRLSRLGYPKNKSIKRMFVEGIWLLFRAGLPNDKNPALLFARTVWPGLRGPRKEPTQKEIPPHDREDKEEKHKPPKEVLAIGAQQTTLFGNVDQGEAPLK